MESPLCKVKLHTSLAAHQREAYPGLISMKRLTRLAVFLLSDGMLVYRTDHPQPLPPPALIQRYSFIHLGIPVTSRIPRCNEYRWINAGGGLGQSRNKEAKI